MFNKMDYHDIALAFTYIATGIALGSAVVAKYIYQPMLDRRWRKFMAEEEPETPFEDLYPLDKIEDNYAHPDDVNITNYININTPNGIVFLRYNNEEEGFEYWSKNKNIKYKYLEVAARKYISIFNCKSIYVDRIKNIEDNKKLKEESEKKEEEGRENNDKEEVIDDVFLKSKPIIKEKINKEEEKEVATKANKYIYKGNMEDFSKKNINIVMVESKKSKMTFADFKKLTD